MSWVLLAACAPTGPIEVAIHPLGAEGEPLAEHHVLPIEFGAQGGFHVFVELSLSNLVPGASNLLEGLRLNNLPSARVTVQGPDGLLNQPHDQSIVLGRSEEGWDSEPLLIVLQYYEDPPPGGFDRDSRELEIEGFVVEFLAEVSDSRGGQGQASGRTSLDFP